jgi:outer membrane protein TolC
MDLPTALNLGAQYSRELQNYRENLYFQGLDTMAVRRQFGPQYAGTLDYIMSWPSAPGASQNAYGALGLNASQILYSGGKLSANAGSSVTTFQTDTISNTYNNSAGISLTQPLLMGAGYEASHNALIQSEQNLLYKLRTFTLQRQDFAISIMGSYYNLLILKANVENTKTNLAQATYLRRRSEALFRVGKGKIDDALRAQQSELIVSNNLELAVITLDTSKSSFLIQLGLPVNTHIKLAGAIPDLKPVPFNKEDCIKLALDLRLDLTTYRDQVEDAKRLVRIAENALLPRLDAIADASVNGNSADSLVNQTYDNTMKLGLHMDLPLDKRNERDVLRRTRIELDEAMRNLDEQSDTIQVSIIDSFRKLKLQEQTVRMQKEIVYISELTLRATMMRFELGNTDNQSVVNAQTALLTAKNQYIQALAAYEEERVQLYRDIGLLDVKTDGIFIELPIPKKETI